MPRSTEKQTQETTKILTNEAFTKSSKLKNPKLLLQNDSKHTAFDMKMIGILDLIWKVSVFGAQVWPIKHATRGLN